MVPAEHPLASVHGAMNAVFVEGSVSGPLMWLGQGAGGGPTATAVLGDVLDAARNRVSDRHDVPFSVDPTLHSVNAGDLASTFYISIDVVDQPGVLAAVAGVFGQNDVSIQSMEQSGFGDEARLSFLTHEALTKNVRATIDELSKLASVDSVGACIRVISEGSK
jgi:homoserine dehydrogenase